MDSIIIYPFMVTQTTETPFIEFNDLNNVKNGSSSYAISKYTIRPKSVANDRPSRVKSYFKADLPAGSRVSSIKIQYADSYEGNLAIAGPTVSLMDGIITKTGKALTKTMTQTSVTAFTGDLTRLVRDSEMFEVELAYPQNTSSEESGGLVKLRYVRVIINYTPPEFEVSAVRTGGKYTSEDHFVRLSVNNIGETDGGTNVTATLPEGVGTIRKVQGDGNITIFGNQFTWKPNIGSKKSANIDLSFSIETSGDHSITFTEDSSNSSATVNLSAVPRPPSPSDPDGIDDDKVSRIDDSISNTADNFKIKNYVGFPTVVCIDLEGGMIAQQFSIISNVANIDILEPMASYIDWEYADGEYDSDDIGYTIENAGQQYILPGGTGLTKDGKWYLFLGNQNQCKAELQIIIPDFYGGDDYEKTFIIEFRPKEDELSIPYMTLLSLTAEELDRLGHGFHYSVESAMKIESNESYVRDWYKNFRIGVFNNQIEANCYTYYEYDNENEDFEDYLLIPSEYALEEGSLSLKSDYPIKLIIGESEVEIGTSDTVIPLFDTYTVPVNFEKMDHDNIILTISILNDQNSKVFEADYHVNFNSETSQSAQEIIVDTTDYSNLSNQEILDNASSWSDALEELNEYGNLVADFVFDENYPLYVLITGDYPEGSPLDTALKFTSPTIRQSDDLSSDKQVLFATPIMGPIQDSLSEIALDPFETSNTHIYYDYSLDGVETDQNNSILGIQVVLTADFRQNTVVAVKLVDGNGKTGVKSIAVTNDDVNERRLVFGGDLDLWGFDIEDMVDLSQWDIEVTFSNPWATETSATLENLELSVYKNTIEDNKVLCYLNGKDTRHYGMFIQSVEIPAGLKTEVKYLENDGIDETEAYRQNIKRKEITIKFNIYGCNIEETSLFLRMLGKLFSNDRTSLNTPIPNRLEFSHYPGEYWNVVLEDPIDSDVESVSYESTIKLIVPDGTSHSTTETVTSYIGTNNSVVRCNPLIQFVPQEPISETIEIHETASVPPQRMLINATGILSSDLLLLDCENRRLILRRYDDEENIYADQDISVAVDWNSDWFSLLGDYYFETKGCVIQTVSFEERW